MKMIDYHKLTIEDASAILTFNAEFALRFVYQSKALYEEYISTYSELSLAEFIYYHHWGEFCIALYSSSINDDGVERVRSGPGCSQADEHKKG